MIDRIGGMKHEHLAASNFNSHHYRGKMALLWKSFEIADSGEPQFYNTEGREIFESLRRSIGYW
jgi:hypothetical protein